MTTLQNPPKNILVPVDFSEASEKAAQAASALAEATGATVHLLHSYLIPVEAVGITYAVSRDYVDNFVTDSTAQLLALGEKVGLGRSLGPVQVVSGDPREVIVAKAKELDVELIVMGTHGRRGLSRVLLGSVAENVVRMAPCSVLVVR